MLSSLKVALENDYEAYREHIALSGCGAIEQRGEYLLIDVSQLHVGGYSSIMLIRPSDKQLYLFWLRSGVGEKDYKLYGNLPAPQKVKEIVADQMNEVWGHVASFSWAEDVLEINLKASEPGRQ